jgi:uncharacterized protein YkwD
MSSARALFARGRTAPLDRPEAPNILPPDRGRKVAFVDRPEAPTILPPPRSHRRALTQGISLLAAVAVVIATGSAEAHRRDREREREEIDLETPADVAPSPAESPAPGSITIPITVPLGESVADPVAGALKGVLEGPAGPILDPLLGPIGSPSASPSPGDPSSGTAPPSAAPNPGKAPAPPDSATNPSPGKKAKPIADPSPSPTVTDPGDEDAPRQSRDPKPAPSPSASPSPTPSPAPLLKLPGDRLNAVERAIFNLVNEERVQAGLPELELDMTLVTAARRHSERMRDAGRLFHTNNLTVAAPSSWRLLGENVGVGSTPDSLHSRFMLSPSHRVNVLGRFDRLGVGAVVSRGQIWVTQRYLRTR